MYVDFGDQASISIGITVTWRIDDTEPLVDYRWLTSDDGSAIFAPPNAALDFARHLINGDRFLVHVKDEEGSTLFGHFFLEDYNDARHPVQQLIEQCSPSEESLVLLSGLSTSIFVPPKHWYYDAFNDHEWISDRSVAHISVQDATIRKRNTRVVARGMLSIFCIEGSRISIDGYIGGIGGITSPLRVRSGGLTWLLDDGAVAVDGAAYSGINVFGQSKAEFSLEEHHGPMVGIVRNLLSGNSLQVQIEASNGNRYHAEFPLNDFVGSEHPVRLVLEACGHKAS